MNGTIRRGAFFVLLSLSAACEVSGPTAPPSPGETPLPGVTAVPRVRPLPSVTRPTNVPALSGPARTFIFEHAGYPVAEYTQQSRFVLYDNGAFALQYLIQTVSIAVHIRKRMASLASRGKTRATFISHGMRPEGSKLIR